MSTPTRQPVKKSTVAPADTRKSNVLFLFDKLNYYIIGAGILLLVIGYLLMAGGAQPQNQFNEDEIYSFRRITLAPVVVILGYAVIAYGIMKKPASKGE